MKLVGEKVFLGGVSDPDLPLILRWRQHPSVCGWFYEYAPSCISQQKRWHDKIVNSSTDEFWAIKKAGPANAHIVGVIGLAHIDWRNRKAEFGRFFMDPSAGNRRKGYGKEALSLLIDYTFNHMNLNKLYCDSFKDNKVAIDLYTSLGFKIEGEFKSHIYKDGKYEDVLYLELLKQSMRSY